MKTIQVAFRCYESDWGMHRGHGSRKIDWLIDGKKLHKDNVVFVIDGTISKEYRKALTKQYHTYDAYSLLMGPSRWERFLKYWQPRHWVSYNDYHPRHIQRNKILHAAGIETWFYSHSVNLPKEEYRPWKELNYKHLVLWNETDAAQFDGGQKHILGPLFSSQVPSTVVAVFDSTWEHYPQGTEEKFFAGLFELLDRHPGMVMLYKPKWKRTPIERPRFYTLPEWIEPGLVIGCAHITISLYRCSTTVEAQGAGKPGIDYNPWKYSWQSLKAEIDEVTMELPIPPPSAADRFRELLLK